MLRALVVDTDSLQCRVRGCPSFVLIVCSISDVRFCSILLCLGRVERGWSELGQTELCNEGGLQTSDKD